jgi:hypothetical protein
MYLLLENPRLGNGESNFCSRLLDVIGALGTMINAKDERNTWEVYIFPSVAEAPAATIHTISIRPCSTVLESRFLFRLLFYQ